MSLIEFCDAGATGRGSGQIANAASTSKSETTRASRMSRSEIIASVKALTSQQKTTLVKIAKLYARKTAYDWEDLIQEAFARVIATDRSWPRDAPIVAFLGGVIRSIAWEWKQNESVRLDEAEVSDEGAEARGVIARLDAQRVLSLFDDDPLARRIVLDMMLGTTAEDLREAHHLTRTAYESKRKKISRRIEKLPRL